MFSLPLQWSAADLLPLLRYLQEGLLQGFGTAVGGVYGQLVSNLQFGGKTEPSGSTDR